MVHTVTGLPQSRIFGFGGDLDHCRLQFVLSGRSLPIEDAIIVGEHGKRTIPVYPGETDYAAVADEVRTFLGKTARGDNRPRNLASGALLASMVNTLLSSHPSRHFVCGYHPDYSVYLTWPFLLTTSGVAHPEQVTLGAFASAELQTLVKDRQASSAG